jgi:mRNA interferase MazF
MLVLSGEIRIVDFEPVRGSEANKQRPAVVSNDIAATTASRFEDCSRIHLSL